MGEQHPLKNTVLSMEEQFQRIRRVFPNAVFNIALHLFKCPLKYVFGLVPCSCLSADLMNPIYECGYQYIEKVLGIPITAFDLASNTWQGPMQDLINKGQLSDEAIETLTNVNSNACLFCPMLAGYRVKTCGGLSKENAPWSSAAQKTLYT
ncbi:hypothetical protein HDU98_004198, partial [Podochytrium sp. JEL0797]